MEEKQLRIFVSGKEDELFNERIITTKVIKSFECIPVGSENRSASDSPIELEYLDEDKINKLVSFIHNLRIDNLSGDKDDGLSEDNKLKL